MQEWCLIVWSGVQSRTVKSEEETLNCLRTGAFNRLFKYSFHIVGEKYGGNWPMHTGPLCPTINNGR